MSRPKTRELFSEALAAMTQRGGRTMLTALGVVLGVGAFVGILGLTSTASGQISTRFTALAATEVTVEDVTLQSDRFAGIAFPDDAEARVASLNGVRNAGVYWPVRPSAVGTISATGLPGDDSGAGMPVIAASPGLLQAVGSQLQTGRLFDEYHNLQAQPVVVLGSGAAARLGVGRLEAQPVVFLGGKPMMVLGIIDDVQRRPELLLAIIVPGNTAKAQWGPPDDPGTSPQMLVDTEIGAAKVIADQVALALRPDAPESFRVVAPADPTALRDQVTSDLSALFLILAGICLVVGAVGIANTTLVAVLERVPEIGLRRALGAQRSHIAAQFLLESGILGSIGGLVGTSLGVLTLVVVAAFRQWTPIIEPWVALLAPLAGTVTGLIAGLYPAIQAARIEPVEALRR